VSLSLIHKFCQFCELKHKWAEEIGCIFFDRGGSLHLLYSYECQGDSAIYEYAEIGLLSVCHQVSRVRH